MSACNCPVCVVLSGLPVADAFIPEQSVPLGLPADVRRVLCAYARIVDGRASVEDIEAVRAAAAVCTGIGFPRLPVAS